MILNKAHPGAAEKIRAESEANPIARVVCAAAETSAEAFEVDVGATGLEISACTSHENRGPQRARMKVFSRTEVQTLVFFYKRSLVPFSRDRYSYGGVELRNSPVETAEVANWLSFLSSGFHPEKRPASLRRAFPFEIPE